jgi:hypothetical protein
MKKIDCSPSQKGTASLAPGRLALAGGQWLNMPAKTDTSAAATIKRQLS